MTFKKLILVSLILGSSFFSSLFAQGKVEGSTLRLKGGLFYGTMKTDLEKRNTFADFFGAQVNQDYKFARGLDLLNNFGAEYFHSLGSGLLSNVFFGLQINGHGRDYEWRSFYPVGVGIKEGKGALGYEDFTVGVTLDVAPGFRILPKYVIRTMAQRFDGSYLGIGAPAFFGTQGATTRATSGLLGASFEYDLNADVTLYADVLIYGPFLYRSKGSYENELITISTGGSSYAYANGGYSFSSQKLTLGGTYQVIPKLRLFASLDQERIDTKGESPTAFVITTAGLSELGTVGQYLAATNEERIKLSGFKFGVTYDIGM
jgi:hypothetical protein